MDELERYIEAITSPEDELLKELDRQTHLQVVQPRMISGHVQGKLLELLTRLMRPSSVLEIGTFTGYSTLCFAAALEEGATIDTFEVDDELESIAASFFARSPHGGKICQHIGSALELAPKLGKTFDMVFIDGDKREYPDYYRMVMGDSTGVPLVRRGSLIIADNILWYGKVARQVSDKDIYTRRIMEFNDAVASDVRVESVVLPLRDGLSLARVVEL